MFQIPFRHSLQEEIARPPRLWSGRRRPHGFGHLAEPGLAAKLAREHRRTEGFQVGLPSQPVVESFERSGGLEEQGWGIIAAAAAEDNLGPEPRRPGPLQLVQRTQFGHREQVASGIGRSRLELGLRRSQRPCGTPGRIRGQLSGPFEESRRCGNTTAGLGLAR